MVDDLNNRTRVLHLPRFDLNLPLRTAIGVETAIRQADRDRRAPLDVPSNSGVYARRETLGEFGLMKGIEVDPRKICSPIGAERRVTSDLARRARGSHRFRPSLQMERSR